MAELTVYEASALARVRAKARMSGLTVYEWLAARAKSEARKSQTSPSWIKPAPVYPTTVNYVTNDTHAGYEAIDLRAPLNSPIKAVYKGIVERVIEMDPRGYGNLIVIRQPDGYASYYAHLNKFGVREGQAVRAGQVIGLAGSTGNSSASHLHYEIRNPSGTSVDPHEYFDTNYRFSEFKGPSGRAEYGASEMIERQVKKFSSQKKDFSIQKKAASTIDGSPEIIVDTPLGTVEIDIFKDRPKEEGEITLLKTPIGDVNIPGLPGYLTEEDGLVDPRAEPWLRIAAVGIGLVMVWIALIALLWPIIKPVAKKAAPMVVGAINPAAGVAAELVT